MISDFIELKEGMVVINHTCDYIDLLIKNKYNQHDERLLVSEIKGDSVRFYNFTTSKCEWRTLKFVLFCIRNGGMSLTNEVA